MAEQHAPQYAPRAVAHPRSWVMHGLIAGALGATAVAVWFLIVDLVNGRPLYTPRILGAAFFGVFGPPMGETAAHHVIGYTLVHYAAFALIGIVLAAIVRRATDDPHVLAGLVIFFFVFQVGFYGFVALLSQWDLLGRLAWYQVGAANVLASALMGGYLWKVHPALGREIRFTLDGREV